MRILSRRNMIQPVTLRISLKNALHCSKLEVLHKGPYEYWIASAHHRSITSWPKRLHFSPYRELLFYIFLHSIGVLYNRYKLLCLNHNGKQLIVLHHGKTSCLQKKVKQLYRGIRNICSRTKEINIKCFEERLNKAF